MAYLFTFTALGYSKLNVDGNALPFAVAQNVESTPLLIILSTAFIFLAVDNSLDASTL